MNTLTIKIFSSLVLLFVFSPILAVLLPKALRKQILLYRYSNGLM